MPPHEPDVPPGDPSSAPEGVPGDAGPTEGGAAVDAASRPLIDFVRTARRLGTAVGVIGALVLVTWTVLVVTGDAPLRLLAELAGLGLLGAFVVEVVVVGGSALRGMLDAGERGERLAAPDVSLVPPQLLRRRSR